MPLLKLMCSFEVFFCSPEFLKILSRNVQTTWRLACRQLSAHSARNQAMPSDTNCKSSPKTGGTTGPLSRRCDSTAHRHVCNKLHKSHSTKLISITLCHVIDFCKALLRSSTTQNNYSQCTISDPEAAGNRWRGAANRKWWLHREGHVQQDYCCQIACFKALVSFNLWLVLF